MVINLFIFIFYVCYTGLFENKKKRQKKETYRIDADTKEERERIRLID